MKLTLHSKERIEERLGLTDKSAAKLAQKALSDGIRHKDVTGALKKYFDSLYLSHGKANNIRLYGEFVYLFNQDFLITVIRLPNEFKKIGAKLRKKCKM